MMIASWFKKIALVALMGALSLSALPLTSVYAAGLSDTNAPPAPTQLSTTRLQQIWGREQNAYDRLGKFFDRADQFVTNAQNRLDQAKSNGKDVSAIQAALDSFSSSLQQAKPIYTSLGSLITSHNGFDNQGNVMDATQATLTVKSIGMQLKQIRDLVGSPIKALRDAIQAFRSANRPVPTPSTSSS
ncbi:MAG TPA: hypothetical protein VMT73_08940 [Anaerolineales bacterium]|nr:hypothetical protein [Anaerolineales bacterium]